VGAAAARGRSGAHAAAGVFAGDTFYCTVTPANAAQHVAADAAGQSRQALDGLTAVLGAVGLVPRDVVNLHVTLADIRHVAAFEAAYGGAFAEPYPARTIVGAPIKHQGHVLQIEAVAVRGGGAPLGPADAALGRASPAMLAADTLYVSGQLGSVQSGDCEAQTRSAWDKINALVAAAGFAADSVLRTNNVLTDWRSYAGFNAGYGANVRAPYPPRATVLGSLPDPAALVQIEAIAHRQGGNAAIVQVPGVP
jgi:enamine deaminase RidA (YjgF/YER057c/UK114 family)